MQQGASVLGYNVKGLYKLLLQKRLSG